MKNKLLQIAILAIILLVSRDVRTIQSGTGSLSRPIFPEYPAFSGGGSSLG